MPVEVAFSPAKHVRQLRGLIQLCAWRCATMTYSTYDFMIVAEGFKRLITHVFRRDDRYLDSDAVFGVRSTLIADWERHPPGKAPDGTESTVPFYTLDFKFVLDTA